MANVGDKYIIEIAEIYASSYQNEAITKEQLRTPVYLYRIKGFNSLVFDKNGLDKLERLYQQESVDADIESLKEKEYERGLNDAWEAARKIFFEKENGGLPNKELSEFFGTYSVPVIFANNSAAEAISKIKVYEEQRKSEEEIKFGDEVITETQIPFIVTAISQDHWCYGINSNTGFTCDANRNLCRKTGRHFDIEGILKAMREE